MTPHEESIIQNACDRTTDLLMDAVEDTCRALNLNPREFFEELRVQILSKKLLTTL